MKLIYRRIVMSLIGVIVCAVAVSFFKLAAMGVDPFQSLMAGLDKMIPIEFGTLYVIVNAALLSFSLITDRHNIGLATFLNMFLLGYITQFALGLLQSVIPDPSMPIRIVSLVIGILMCCLGGSLIMTASMGVSTYDAVAITMAYKWKWGKFQYIRIATDVVCVLLGCIFFMIGGGALRDIPTIAGIGTIITAFFMGPVMEFINVHFSRPLLYGKPSKQS